MSEDINPDYQMKTIVLRDLQSLLRQTMGDDVIVESFTTKSLLPPGENYGSTILGVYAVIRRTKNSDEEDLHFIAKMLPPTEFQRRIFDSPYTFRKEIFMYDNILPGYNKLEIECGLSEDRVFNVLPKLYGSRLSLNPNGDFDDDAVILLENLKVRGYYTGKRYKGYDLEHSKFAIRAMARFHALGIAMKHKKPEEFEVFKVRAKCLEIKDPDSYAESYRLLLTKIKEDPDMAVHYERCNKAITEVSVDDVWIGPPKEPWASIIHADFWVNNIMFHRGEEGQVDDVKFVDFQNYLYLNPIRELIFFIFSSTDEDIDEKDIDNMIDIYHETFINVLSNMDCDTVPFTKQKFDAQLPGAGLFEFMHLCFMLKVLTLNAAEMNLDHSKIQSVMLTYAGNQMFINRLRKVVLYFVKHDWI